LRHEELGDAAGLTGPGDLAGLVAQELEADMGRRRRQRVPGKRLTEIIGLPQMMAERLDRLETRSGGCRKLGIE
jgi:hypothetical protein